MFTLLVSFARAQAQGPTESLLIGRGDLLHIQVYDTPQMEQHVRVDDAGNAPLLFIGKIHLQGDTPAQAASLIEATLVASQIMRHPQVSAAIEQFATQDVSVIGQVGRPGGYPVSTPRSLASVLSLAGGLNERADRNVSIQRAGDPKRIETVYLSSETSSAGEILVNPGDTVTVPKAKLVYVLGDVARPGAYPLRNGDTQATFIELLAECGSPNKSAVLKHASLMHKSDSGYAITTVNLSKIMAGKAPTLTMQPDDVLYIPFSYVKSIMLDSAALLTAASTASVKLP